jgi:hypothetical protein
MEPWLSSMLVASFGGRGRERERERERQREVERKERDEDDGKQSKKTLSSIRSEIETTPCHREVRESPVLAFAVSHPGAQARSGDPDLVSTSPRQYKLAVLADVRCVYLNR